MIGSVVAGRYRVEAELGRGGMGVVYRAVQLPIERPVALKVLRRELVDAPKARARFERAVSYTHLTLPTKRIV